MTDIDKYIKALTYKIHKKYGHCLSNRQWLGGYVHFFYKPVPGRLEDFQITYTELEECRAAGEIPEKIKKLLYER